MVSRTPPTPIRSSPTDGAMVSCVAAQVATIGYVNPLQPSILAAGLAVGRLSRPAALEEGRCRPTD